MKLVIAILLAFVVATVGAPAAASAVSAADAATLSDDQPAQREQPSPATDAAQTGATDENSSAAWGSALWVVIAIVAAAAFVSLAMIGLRGSQRRTHT